MKRFALFLVAIALCLAAVPMHATTLLSENFDELTANLDQTSVGAFTAINGTNVDIVGPGNDYGYLCASPESGNCVDMGGSGGNPYGQLQSSAIVLGAGTVYLSFDLVGNQRPDYELESTTDVTLGPAVGAPLYSNSFILLYNDDSSGIVTDFPITVTSPETVYLNFTYVDTPGTNGNVGALLDNVQLTENSNSPVPEPSSLLLLGSGLAALAGGLWKRRKIGA
jgi:hypothetical protein